MKLTKKHIGGFFDVHGSDGSWFYELLDVSRHELLFRSFLDGRFEIESRRHSDWRRFTLTPRKLSDKEIKQAWHNGRRAP